MTHQKSIPTGSRFHHNPSTDHPPQMHTQRDIRSQSGVRVRETINNGRCSDQSCQRQLMDKNARRKNVAGATSLATTQDLTCALKVLDQQEMTWESLEVFLTPKELDRLCLSRTDLHYFWSASIDPPVTKASLGELDLGRISSDPKLRHDVNFDHEVSFRPNLQGEAGVRKLALAKGYWDALVIEFQLYILRCRNIFSKCKGAPGLTESLWLLRPVAAGKVRLRLPNMFQVVNEILKSLIPESEWATVDAHLDVELLIQELENGVCDIVALSEWLGDLLQGSCSPMRDSSVQATVSTIQRGVEGENARLIVDGIKSLFGILETMKLDVANHQIRTLRFLMVDDFVQFQQKVFLCRLRCEPSLRNAYSWFTIPNTMPEVQDKRGYATSMELFSKELINLVSTNSSDFPATFEYDFERLRILQSDFQTCLLRSACCDIFIDTLHVVDPNKPSSSENRDSIQNQIFTFTKNLDITRDPSRHVKDVALQIVQEAYKTCNIKSLPSDSLLAKAEHSLRQAWIPTSPIYENLSHALSHKLGDLVNDAIKSVAGLSPLQLLDHLNPVQFEPELPHERCSLLNMSRRIAHIAILHWRVWAPILYLQPWESGIGDVVTMAESRESLMASCGILEDGPRKSSFWHRDRDRDRGHGFGVGDDFDTDDDDRDDEEG